MIAGSSVVIKTKLVFREKCLALGKSGNRKHTSQYLPNVEAGWLLIRIWEVTAFNQAVG
jgi:hypothetical protein